MKRIVITLPHFFEGEGCAIARMLECGAERVHIRKPGCSEAQMRALIESIPTGLRHRISMHDYLGLACEYGIGGVHLNSRNGGTVPAGFGGMVSRSCHSIDELHVIDCDYVFLSPVFDSISKAGYKSAFTLAQLSTAAIQGLINDRVYALGGVTPANFELIAELGFGGCALLSGAWTPVNMDNFSLQYIAGPAEGEDLVESTCAGAAKALEGGCRWVQVRMKDASDAEVVEAARRLGPMCNRMGATMLLDDRVHLVVESGAHGVHLGKNDMLSFEARQQLGPGYIIGATANTYADIEAAAAQGADYIGLGPLRFTTTKKNLSPVLGYDGYCTISACCREKNIALPIVAIGGVTPADVAPLLAAGVQGVAVSGAISKAADPAAAAAEFIRYLS